MLALDLGVHFSTVAEAYRTLSGEGWLELKRRHGATVTERRNPKAAPAARADFGKRLRELIAQVRSEGLTLPAIRNELATVTNELAQ
jgi:DNA-binding transcriptional regulator YhcF (GntR family)